MRLQNPVKVVVRIHARGDRDRLYVSGLRFLCCQAILRSGTYGPAKGGLLDVGAEVIGQLDRPHPREQAVGAAPLRVMPYAR